MNKIIIKPLESFNEISFGTKREVIWEKIGNPKNSFKKTQDSVSETDDYNDFHIYYDENYCFEAIEIFGNVEIYYNNDQISNKYSEVLEYFKKTFNDIEEDEYGFITKEGSIGVYIENDDNNVDAILFGKKGYYDFID